MHGQRNIKTPLHMYFFFLIIRDCTTIDCALFNTFNHFASCKPVGFNWLGLTYSSRVVRRSSVSQREDSAVSVTYEKSSLNISVNLLKGKVLYLTVYGDNDDDDYINP
jgi:hypothetical protein